MRRRRRSSPRKPRRCRRPSKFERGIERAAGMAALFLFRDCCFDYVVTCGDRFGVRTAGADGVVPSLSRQRGLAAGCLVVKRKPVKLILLRRRDRDVAVSPSVGGDLTFLQHGLELPVDTQIAPHLLERFPSVARIKQKWILDLHSRPAVATEF